MRNPQLVHPLMDGCLGFLEGAGEERLVVVLLLSPSGRENLGHLLLEARFPLGNLCRMHPVGAGSLIDGFEPFERFERHTSFELSAVLFSLCRHLRSPHSHLLLTQHSIFITCPVFGVHYIPIDTR